MFFLQIAQVPVVVNLGGKYEAVIPKYTLRKAVEWGASIAQKWQDAATAGLSPEKKADYLSFNPTIPPTLNNLRQLCQTVEGAAEIVSASVRDAQVYLLDDTGARLSPPISPEEKAPLIQAMLENAGTGALCNLSWMLADLKDISTVALSQKTTPATGEEGADPLQSGGKTA